MDRFYLATSADPSELVKLCDASQLDAELFAQRALCLIEFAKPYRRGLECQHLGV